MTTETKLPNKIKVWGPSKTNFLWKEPGAAAEQTLEMLERWVGWMEKD